MKVEFIEPEFVELDDAINYYNIQSDGLGNKFLEEILANIRFISKFPNAWPKYTEHTFKITLRKFPYNLIFTIKKIQFMSLLLHTTTGNRSIGSKEF